MATTARSLSWRVIDIVTAAVLGVACGLIFVAWNQVGYAGYEALKAIAPGLGGLVTGVWLLGGTLGGYIIRKPGAALFVELMAATISMGLGSQWAVETLYSGLAQGIGAEIVFALLAYRRFNVWVAAAAGALSFCLRVGPRTFSSPATSRRGRSTTPFTWCPAWPRASFWPASSRGR